MASKSPKISIVFNRRHTATKVRKASVDIQINFQGKQKIISTGVLLTLNQWNSTLLRAKGKDAEENNEKISFIYNKVRDISFEMVDKCCVDINAIPEILTNISRNVTFYDFIEERIPLRKVRESTRERYRCWIKAFKEYGKISSFAQIDRKAIFDYDDWLHSQTKEVSCGKGKVRKEPKFCQGTIHNYHKYLKIFINDAIMYEHVKENPYEKYKIKIDKGDKLHTDYLTAEQVKDIANLSFVGYMKKVQDLFLFQCYTGISFSDIFLMDKKKCTKSKYGLLYTNARYKTGQEFTILLCKDAINILDRYDWSFPEISNQKYNSYLKVLGAAIGEPKLHSHQARGAFATIAMNNGIAVGIVQKMLGHAKIDNTMRYASVLDDTIARQMSMAF